MWGYDRDEDTTLIPFKSQDQHFKLFCMVLERGFALHTGRSERLIIDFRLNDAGSSRYLPKVNTKRGVSFSIPESCLVPSQLYLHYDPKSEADMPEMAMLEPGSNQFIPYDYETTSLFNSQIHTRIELPVVKLASLKGLHYVKDVACLQMYTLDFDRLYSADPTLADQVREMLSRKLLRFVEFTYPWLQANHAEKVAKDYLSKHPSKVSKRRISDSDFDRGEKANETGNDQPFMSWD